MYKEKTRRYLLDTYRHITISTNEQARIFFADFRILYTAYMEKIEKIFFSCVLVYMYSICTDSWRLTRPRDTQSRSLRMSWKRMSFGEETCPRNFRMTVYYFGIWKWKRGSEVFISVTHLTSCKLHPFLSVIPPCSVAIHRRYKGFITPENRWRILDRGKKGKC